MEKSRNHKITTTQGMSGFFAVHVAEFLDDTGVWYQDIVSTGIGRYKSSEKAEDEGKQWAKDENLPFE
jgi:hypothetical protein